MAEPLDPDRDAGQTPLPDSNGSDEGLSEDDLDIDALVSVWRDDLLLDAIGARLDGSDRPDVPFDVSADRQLIEALLKWRRDVESDPPAPVAPDLVRDTPRTRTQAAPVATGSGCRSSRPLPLPWWSLSLRWPPTAPRPTRPCGRSPRSSTANTPRPSKPPTMRGRPRRKPKRQWRQDTRTRPQAALNAAASRIPQVRSQDGQTNLQSRQRDLERQLDTPRDLAAATTSEPSTSPRSPRTSAAPKPTSHSLRPESPTARPKESHDSTAQTRSATPTTPQTHPTAGPTSASPTSPQHREQPGKPPRPTRSATPPTTRPAPSTARPDSKAAPTSAPRVVPVKPSNKKASLTTPQPEAKANGAPSTGQAVAPSSSVRTTGNRQRQTAARQPDSPAPTPRLSPDSAPS